MIIFFTFSSKMELDFFPFVTPTYSGKIVFPGKVMPYKPDSSPKPVTPKPVTPKPVTPKPVTQMEYFAMKDGSKVEMVNISKVAEAKKYAKNNGIAIFYMPNNRTMYRLTKDGTRYSPKKEGIYGMPVNRDNVDPSLIEMIEGTRNRDNFKENLKMEANQVNMNKETKDFLDEVIKSIK